MNLSEEVLYTRKLSGEKLQRLIHDCTFQNTARFLGEQLPQHLIDDQKRSNLLLFTWHPAVLQVDNYLTTTGRIFDKSCELRWELIGKDEFQVIYLGHKQNISILKDYGLKSNDEFSEFIQNDQIEKKDAEKILFGKFLEAQSPLIANTENIKPFAEARIPRILYYPLNDKAEYVKMNVIEYWQIGSGSLLTFRFESLKPVKK